MRNLSKKLLLVASVLPGCGHHHQGLPPVEVNVNFKDAGGLGLAPGTTTPVSAVIVITCTNTDQSGATFTWPDPITIDGLANGCWTSLQSLDLLEVANPLNAAAVVPDTVGTLGILRDLVQPIQVQFDLAQTLGVQLSNLSSASSLSLDYSYTITQSASNPIPYTTPAGSPNAVTVNFTGVALPDIIDATQVGVTISSAGINVTGLNTATGGNVNNPSAGAICAGGGSPFILVTPDRRVPSGPQTPDFSQSFPLSTIVNSEWDNFQVSGSAAAAQSVLTDCQRSSGSPHQEDFFVYVGCKDPATPANVSYYVITTVVDISATLNGLGSGTSFNCP